MVTETRVQRHYLTRINKENGEVTYVTIESYDQLPRTRQSIDEAVGYDVASTARAICTRMNQISELINGRYEYFETRRDENTFPNTSGLSEEALKWLIGEDVPDEGEEPAQ